MPAPSPSSSSTDNTMEVGSSDHPKSAVLIDNPLARMSAETVAEDASFFTEKYNLQEYRDAFIKGALVAKAQNKEGFGFETIQELTVADKDALLHELGHRWTAYPVKLYLLCALCAGCAIVQGMDQTVINGAQMFYFDEFGIKDKVMQGLINGAPYLAAASMGCWLNAPLNKRWGRRGAIALSCLFAFLTAIWQAVSPGWECFLAARLALGLAVGAKSSTTPIYAAECAPKTIRGAMTMMWQMWTAFGIMLGFVVSLACQDLDFIGPHSQWRWMIGLTALPPMIVGACVYLMPESPRWYMEHGDFHQAFISLKQLRKNDIQAARDMYLAYKHLEAEQTIGKKMTTWQVLKTFVTDKRIRRAAQSSWFCMFMQQFCGVNVIAYYSTKIFTDAGFSWKIALLVSFGTGACNWLGAIPAIMTIDRFGRRGLLLCTFPAMALCLFMTGLGFQLTEGETRLRLVAASIYFFMVVYSPGMGPVPFTYSAEAFPLQVRALGMSSATAITWGFNFLISFTWPKMMERMTPAGAFYWYAAWNVFGWVFTFFLLPETKGKSLEELDGVFRMSNREHVRWHFEWLSYHLLRLLGKDAEAMQPLYPVNDVVSETETETETDSSQVNMIEKVAVRTGITQPRSPFEGRSSDRA